MPLRQPATAGFFVGGESEGFPRLASHLPSMQKAGLRLLGGLKPALRQSGVYS